MYHQSCEDTHRTISPVFHPRILKTPAPSTIPVSKKYVDHCVYAGDESMIERLRRMEIETTRAPDSPFNSELHPPAPMFEICQTSTLSCEQSEGDSGFSECNDAVQYDSSRLAAHPFYDFRVSISYYTDIYVGHFDSGDRTACCPWVGTPEDIPYAYNMLSPFHIYFQEKWGRIYLSLCLEKRDWTHLSWCPWAGTPSPEMCHMVDMHSAFI